MLDLTKTFVACSACPRRFSTGDGILVDPAEHLPEGWVPPRGWAGSTAPVHRSIMTVSLNPGHPIAGELERFAAAGAVRPTTPADVSDEVAQAILDFCSKAYDTRVRSPDLIYHKKVIGYIRAAAWLLQQQTATADIDPGAAPWRNLAWITDCFKCSTSRDRGPRIPPELIQRCVALHLRKELEAVKPRLVIALGGAAHNALTRAGIVHARVRHPSNGCPPLDSADHDADLAQMATLLGLPSSVATSVAFREFRRRVQADLFR